MGKKKNIKKSLVIKIIIYCLIFGLEIFFLVYFDDRKVSFYLMIAILSLAMLWFALYLCSKIYAKIINRLFDPLDNKCDPEQYLENVEKYKNRINKKFRECLYIINKSIGLRSLGKLDEAIENLKSYDTNNFPHINYKVLYYINLSDLYIYKNDFEEAEKNLNSAKIYSLETQNLGKELINCIVVNEYLIKMYKGNHEGCEETFSKSLNEAKKLSSKVEEHYNLGTLYYLSKQYDKAKEHFSFVINYGNKSFLVNLAKEKLEKIKSN